MFGGLNHLSQVGLNRKMIQPNLRKMIQLPLGWCNETTLPAFECPSLGQIECHDKNWNPVPENADLCKVRDM